MCLAVYLGSQLELPTSKWNKKNPSFFSLKVQDDDVVKKQFSKEYVYYLGSHEGCGCGFLHDNYAVDEQDPEEIRDNELREKCRKILNDYLKDALERSSELELFICWEGDQGDEPKNREVVTLEEISKAKWDFDTSEFYRIVELLSK